MPPPEPHHPEPRASRPTAPGQSGRDSGRRGPGSSSARQRPSPTSSLSPSPSPLMSVPDPTEAAEGASSPEGSSGAARAGRRQHHRPPGAHRGAATEELVYLSGRVPRALRDELHIRAINEGRPVVDLLRDAIRRYLDRGSGEGPR
jgi:hypothetical protein